MRLRVALIGRKGTTGRILESDMWVIQSDMFQINERDAILSVLDRFDIEYQIVSLASDGSLTPEIDHDGSIITNGSVMLSRIARERGWHPGGFLNDNFSYDVWYPHFKNRLLNRDAIFSTLHTADPPLDRFFIRPLSDNKSFTGRVMERSDFNTWRSSMPDMDVLYAPARAIGQEHRHFIVDGKVISSSRYKMGQIASTSSMVDRSIVSYAEHAASIWSPARAFVLDTYVTEDEIGIVELGCIGNAGFYAADVQKIVMALNEVR